MSGFSTSGQDTFKTTDAVSDEKVLNSQSAQLARLYKFIQAAEQREYTEEVKIFEGQAIVGFNHRLLGEELEREAFSEKECKDLLKRDIKTLAALTENSLRCENHTRYKQLPWSQKILLMDMYRTGHNYEVKPEFWNAVLNGDVEGIIDSYCRYMKVTLPSGEVAHVEATERNELFWSKFISKLQDP